MITIESLIRTASGIASGVIAVAAAHDEEVLKAVCEAKHKNIASAVLIGDTARIRGILAELGEDADGFELMEAESDAECAAKAVSAVRSGRANLLMKGILNTADLMRAVLDKENGIRTERLISHVMLYQPAGYRMMALTDGGMNPFPDLAKKIQILENAAILMRSIGFERLYAACICGAETVNPKIQSMVDAQELAGMTERWGRYDMQVYGPVGLDLAVSLEACAHKKYNAPGAGMADILLAPNYEVGNAMGKAMSLFGGAKNAGIIVGARVPIVLVSRSDNAETKLASIALGAVAARG